MDLRLHGLIDPGPVRANLPAAQLIELALGRDEGILASNGALVVRTGKYTGRAARDKYVVHRALSQDSVSWGSTNQPLDAERFVNTDKSLLRPTEIPIGHGDPSKAARILNWQARTKMPEVARLLVDDCVKDLERVRV